MHLIFSIDSAFIFLRYLTTFFATPSQNQNMKIAELKSLSVDELWNCTKRLLQN